MTILESIKRTQQLVKKLSGIQQVDDNPLAVELVTALEAELDTMKIQAQQLSNAGINASPSSPREPKRESGCYIFSDQKGFFCPNCYDQYDRKVATTRVNKKLRVCPACRSSIK